MSRFIESNHLINIFNEIVNPYWLIHQPLGGIEMNDYWQMVLRFTLESDNWWFVPDIIQYHHPRIPPLKYEILETLKLAIPLLDKEHNNFFKIIDRCKLKLLAGPAGSLKDKIRC